MSAEKTTSMVGVHLPHDVLLDVDKARGSLPRSRWVRNLIEEYLVGAHAARGLSTGLADVFAAMTKEEADD